MRVCVIHTDAFVCICVCMDTHVHTHTEGEREEDISEFKKNYPSTNDK